MELFHPAARHGHAHDDASLPPTRRHFLTSLFAAGVVAPYAFGQAFATDRGDLAAG